MSPIKHHALPCVLVLLAAMTAGLVTPTRCVRPPATGDAPYLVPRFKRILAASKLQAPNSTSAIHDLTVPISNENFYLSAPRRLTFAVTRTDSYNARAELRLIDEWSTRTNNRKMLKGRVLVRPAPPGIDEFTFFQVHGGVKPLLRIAWRRRRDSDHVDYLYAAIRHGVEDDQTTWWPLSPRPASLFTVKITVRNNVLRVWLNGERKIRQNVSYWQEYQNYFKAGGTYSVLRKFFFAFCLALAHDSTSYRTRRVRPSAPIESL